MLITVRSGLTLNEHPAKSIKRLENKYGPVDVNRSTVDYMEQKKLYEEWLDGKHPDIPVVLNPKYSSHVYRPGDTHSACAIDSDTYNVPWAEYGWIQVNKKEPWHREYFITKDTHRNDVEPPANEIEEKETDMPGIRVHHQVFTNGNQAYVVETETGFFIPDSAHLAALVKAYSINLDKLPALNEYDWNAVQAAKTYNNSGYPDAS
jgi:hypothetical protein